MKSIKRAMLGVLCCVFISFVFAITISANGQNDDAPAPYIWIGNIKLENGKYIESAESSTTDIAPEDNYAHYENGTRDIPIKILIELADLYAVNLDYLVGRSDKKDKLP